MSKKYSLISAYIDLIRVNYWFKNIFVVPGIFFSYFFIELDNFLSVDNFKLISCAFISIFSVCSANYVINEITDAKFDKFHSVKKNRPIVSGKISINSALIVYIILTIFSFYVSSLVNKQFSFWIFILFIMGLIYNVEPIRLKDLPFLDVLCESFNNLIRLLLGWNIFLTDYVPPISLCIVFWTGGSFLMTMKRYAEYQFINNKKKSSNYRKSFNFYTKESLILFGNASAMFCCVFIGIFLSKYKIELILLTPFIVCLFTYYFYLSQKKDSIAQSPEYLFKDHILISLVSIIILILCLLLFYDLEFMEIFNNKLIKNTFY
jgi:decaprenyl-phosphate phosphoribosyltransferase